MALTTKELIEELSKYPDDVKWYGNEEDGGCLVSEYTGDIKNAQIVIDCPEE